MDNVEAHELDYVFDTIDIAHENKISYAEFKAFYSTLSNMTDEVTRRRAISNDDGGGTASTTIITVKNDNDNNHNNTDNNNINDNGNDQNGQVGGMEQSRKRHKATH